MTEITLIGNEGFCVVTASARIYVDAFYRTLASVGGPPAVAADQVTAADLILVTHCHWDHFDAALVTRVAARTGARVAGPRSVVSALAGRLPPAVLLEMEPPSDGKCAAAVRTDLGVATVTAFRTYHSRDHNSYLVDSSGFRFFHDGDNEDTRRLDRRQLGRLDALLIGPWKGSGWVSFIDQLAPARYFLMHLTDEELDEHEAGRFLPEICDHVPAGLVVLRPGQTFCCK